MHQTAFFRTFGGPKEGQHGVKLLLGNNSRKTVEIKNAALIFFQACSFLVKSILRVGQVILPSVSGSSWNWYHSLSSSKLC